MGTFTKQITINASKEKIWNTLGDIGSIHVWNPGVVDSHTTSSGEIGLGSARYCNLGGKNYLEEEVVEWIPGKKMTIRIVGTNLPFAMADIRFKLENRGSTTDVTVSPEYKLKYGVIGKLLDVMMVRTQYGKGMEGLLQGLKQHVEN